MNVIRTVFLLFAVSLAGCGGTRTLDGDPARWESMLDTSDRVTVHEMSGDRVAIRYETIEDGVLYGARHDDPGSAYAIPVDEIEKLELDDAGGGSTGKTLAIVGLVVLGVALLDALQELPVGFPAYE